jgi:hypothetical protein
MTKAEEILVIQDAINTLGPNSYIGPWLKEVLPQIQWAITSDFLPDVEIASIQDATRQAADIIEKANNRANTIIAQANTRAASTLKESNEYTQKQRETAINSLRRAINVIENY